MPNFRILLAGILSVFWAVFLTSCSSIEKNSDTPEGAFALAQEFDQGERYEEAIKRYQDVKNRFPYSKYALASELAIADAYYKQESFAEAQVSYQSFRDLHPKHSKIDYVIFKLAMSYFHQLPESIDRDLSIAPQANATFSELITSYPKSEHLAEAKEKRNLVLKMLAEKEQYIADFYFKRREYSSALSRYRDLLKNYSGLGLDEAVKEKIAACEEKK